MSRGAIILTLIFSLFQTQNSLSQTNPIPITNHYFQTGKKSLTTNNQNPLNDDVRNYRFPFPGPIPPIKSVYYTTSEIDAQTYKQDSPLNSNLKFIAYNIAYDNHSSTHLSTNITGYFVWPYIKSITIMYVLIFENNPFIQQYIVFRLIQFTNRSPTVFQTAYPSKYLSGHSITYACMIQSLRFYIYKNSLQADNFNIQFKIYSNLSPFETQIQVSSAISNYNYYRFTCLLAIVDNTAMLNDYPNYRFTAGRIDTTYQTYSIVTSNKNISEPENNFISGLEALQFYNDREPSLKFSYTPTANGFEFEFHGDRARNGSSSYYISYSYLMLAYYECPKNFPIYKSQYHVCYNACFSGEYYNPITAKCANCSDYCNNCSNFNQCLSCVSSQNRYLNNYACVPKDGFYQKANTLVAAQCTFPCLHCSLSPTNCTKCTDFDWVLSNFECKLCGDIFYQCKTCIATECLECRADHYLLNMTFCKHNCQNSCKKCDDFNHTNCIQCIPGYRLVMGKCLVMPDCGDGYVDPSEDCDDGGFVARDGCSTNCKVESGYQCHFVLDPTGANKTTHCAFTNAIDFSIVSQQKLEYSNEMEIVISVQHFKELFWDRIDDLSKYFRVSPFAYRNIRLRFLERSPQALARLQPRLQQKFDTTSLMVLTFQYLQSINLRNLTLSFNFSRAVNLTLSQIPPSSQTFTLFSDNGRLASVYSDDTYIRTALLAYIFEAISYVLLFYLAVSYFAGGRILAAEALMVVQVTYFSLLTEPQLGPYSVCLTHLRPTFSPIALNTFFHIRPFDDAMTVPKVKGMQLFSQFIFNFNVGAGFILLPLIVSIFTSIVGCLSENEQRTQFWKLISQRFLIECVFAGLLYAGCAVGVSSVLQLTIGIAERQSVFGIVSIVEMSLLLCLYIFYGVLRAAKRQLFGETEAILLENSEFSLAFQILLFYSGAIIGSLIVLCDDWKWMNAAIAVFFTLLYLFTLGQPIFRSNRDKYRTQFNLLTMALAQTPHIYSRFRSEGEYSNDSDAALMVPAFAAILLVLNFAINSSFFIYLFLKKSRDWKPKSKLEVFNMSTPITDLNKPKFRKGFIEYSEGSDPQLQIDIPAKFTAESQFQKYSPPINRFLNSAESSHPLRKGVINSAI